MTTTTNPSVRAGYFQPELDPDQRPFGRRPLAGT